MPSLASGTDADVGVSELISENVEAKCVSCCASLLAAAVVDLIKSGSVLVVAVSWSD